MEIYTDGGCEPNPGPGGYGVVLLHPKKRAEASGGSPLRLCVFALKNWASFISSEKTIRRLSS